MVETEVDTTKEVMTKVDTRINNSMSLVKVMETSMKTGNRKKPNSNTPGKLLSKPMTSQARLRKSLSIKHRHSLKKILRRKRKVKTYFQL